MKAMIVFFCIAAFICRSAKAGGVYPAAPVAAAPVAAPVYTVSRPYTYSTYRVYTNNFKGSPYVAAPVAAAPVAAYPAAPVAAAVATYPAAPVAAAVAAPVAAAAVPAAPLTYTYTSYAGYGYPYYGAYVGYIKK
ncbi:unnamed protein product [Larinioides sclopetarius]|uniref:Uncharacterized protein n=1 Tax=Larinioides sclopetarius TaxID=280406 RepID=A0AAV2BG79_9ARAC